jgi:hypothetical protein
MDQIDHALFCLLYLFVLISYVISIIDDDDDDYMYFFVSRLLKHEI